MKVLAGTLRQPALGSRVLIVCSLSIALLFSIFLSSAAAITRSEVLNRAGSWVKRRVSYSQRSYYQGYRKDCSGFVSMAWKLETSYSSRTISARARRVSLSTLKPGDAILTPGHVSLFGGWKNKARREYIAIEQTTWGSHAKRHVRRMSRRAVGLRRRGILDRPRTRVARRPASPRPATPAVPRTIVTIADRADGSATATVAALGVSPGSLEPVALPSPTTVGAAALALAASSSQPAPLAGFAPGPQL